MKLWDWLGLVVNKDVKDGQMRKVQRPRTNRRLIKKKMSMILSGRESMKVMSFIQMT